MEAHEKLCEACATTTMYSRNTLAMRMEHSMMSGNVDFKSPCAESMGVLACYYDTAGNRTSNTEVRGNWRAGNAKQHWLRLGVSKFFSSIPGIAAQLEMDGPGFLQGGR